MSEDSCLVSNDIVFLLILLKKLETDYADVYIDFHLVGVSVSVNPTLNFNQACSINLVKLCSDHLTLPYLSL